METLTRPEESGGTQRSRASERRTARRGAWSDKEGGGEGVMEGLE